jgi:hypothetical protein
MTDPERSDTLQRLYRAEHGRLLRYFRTRVGREEAPICCKKCSRDCYATERLSGWTIPPPI